MKRSINFEIALTHILARKRQSMIVALGITIAIGIFIFLNSMVIGLNRYTNGTLFRTSPNIRVYREDELSKPLNDSSEKNNLNVIINPKISNNTKNLINPTKLVNTIRNQKEVVAAAPFVTINLFYNNGKSQLDGVSSGVNIKQANAMFNIQSDMLDGDLNNLSTTSNGILISNFISEHLNIKLEDNLSVTSSTGVIKIMKVVGIFKNTGFTTAEKSRSYINITSAQELIGEGPTYVTDIYVNIINPDKAPESAKRISNLTGYTAKDWQSANEMVVSGQKMRAMMLDGISLALLLVAAFGIYNILNMTILQKLNDIAILKATGFSGRDVVVIFILHALIIGFVGVVTGLVFGSILIEVMKQFKVGGDIGHFPIDFELVVFVFAFFFGMIITFGAGFIPARKAAKVDPISIFRK